MLRNVLEDYLSRLKDEREFDLPFLSLLSAMGFRDIHYTHGNAEFGKDFIAKRVEGGELIQYSFQSKLGDVKQEKWREIQLQMLEAVIAPRSHPNFDDTLPHQSVLVLTGDLKGNAPRGVITFNEKLEKINERPMEKWDRQDLIDLFRTQGLEGVHRASAAGFVNYGQFYAVYGKCLQGLITEREIEQHSHSWIEVPEDADERLLIAAVEAVIIAAKCLEKGLVFEAVKAYLGLLRAAMLALYADENKEQGSRLLELHDQVLISIRRTCDLYLTDMRERWGEADRDLLNLVGGPALMVTYPVHCARVLDASGLKYFLEDDEEKRADAVSFLSDFIAAEPGCGHMISDRYAVSLVSAVLSLCDSGRAGVARELLRRAALWLIDRHEKGVGLASFEAAAYTEVATLLGYPFESVEIHKRPSSFLATVISDLAAFAGDARLYEDIVNDIKAAGIIPQYWQPKDTSGQFSVYGGDVTQYPTSLNYSDSFTPFEEFRFAEHMKKEARTYRLAGIIGSASYLALSIFLRDRYFPTLWPALKARSSER